MDHFLQEEFLEMLNVKMGYGVEESDMFKSLDELGIDVESLMEFLYENFNEGQVKVSNISDLDKFSSLNDVYNLF